MSSDKLRAYHRQYRAKNGDKINARARVWKKANPDRVKGYSRKNYAANPSKARDKALRRKFGITLTQYEALRAKHKNEDKKGIYR